MAEPQNQTAGRLLGIEELASEFAISKNTIYYWVHRNQIPHLKMGRHLRFQRDVVIEFFKSKTGESRPTCRPMHELIEPKAWYGEKSPRGSLKTEKRALLKQRE